MRDVVQLKSETPAIGNARLVRLQIRIISRFRSPPHGRSSFWSATRLKAENRVAEKGQVASMVK